MGVYSLKSFAFKKMGPGKPWCEEASAPLPTRLIQISRSASVAFACPSYSNLAGIELQTIPMVSGINSFLDLYTVQIEGRK